MTDKGVGIAAKFRLVSLAIALIATIFGVLAVQLGVGSFDNPGPGMWPLIVAIFVGASAIALLVTERDADDYDPLTRRSFIVIVGFLMMAAYIVGFTYVGMTLTSLVFSVVWLRFIARESWRVAWIAGIGFTVAVVGVFAIALRIPIPHDPIVSLILTGRL